MSKFKVGDKVRVKRDLKSETVVGDYYFNEDMADLRGEIFTIKEIVIEVIYLHYRMVENDYSWDEEMLEEVEESEIKKIEKNRKEQKTFKEVIRDIKEGEVWMWRLQHYNK